MRSHCPGSPAMPSPHPVVVGGNSTPFQLAFVGCTLAAFTRSPLVAPGKTCTPFEKMLAPVGLAARVTELSFWKSFWFIHMTALNVEYMMLNPPLTTVSPLPVTSQAN